MIEAIQNRRSIRKFDATKPVTKEQLNQVLKACSLGLGTCWCGVYPQEERMSSIRELLDIKAPKILFNVIAVGVPAETPDRRGFFESEKVTYVE